MKRRINLQTKVLWITYLILAFTFKDNLICNIFPTFWFFTAKAFMHLFFGMINQEEMREIKNKCSSKDDYAWIVFLFHLSGVIMLFEVVFIFILNCGYRRGFISESPNYLMLYLPNIGFAILNLSMAINIHKIKSIRENSNEVDTKINENILLLKKHLEQFDKPLINIANSSKNNIKCFLEEWSESIRYLIVQEEDDIRIEICSFNIPLKKVLQIQDVYELRKYVERPVYWSPYSILYRDFFKLT